MEGTTSPVPEKAIGSPLERAIPSAPEKAIGSTQEGTMSEARSGSRLVATLALLALLAGSVLAFAPVTMAEHGNDSDAYVIEQGEQCVAVDPITNDTQSVEDFYDYRHPDSDPNASTYSSYGTTEYQADNTSILMLYEGSEGTSLVIVHEKLHEPAEDGTNGSSATFVVTGLSDEDDGWVVEDDDYNESSQDDVFVHNDTHSEMTWVWGQGRTDGAAYRGLDGDTDIEIDPGFNEDANFRYSGQYAGWVHDWEVITATDDGFDRVGLDSLEENVTVRAGYCAAAPNASLTVDDATPEVGLTTVTLDASGTTSETDVVEYRWDLSDNGTVDLTTEDPVLEHVFTDTGDRDVAVTAVAEDGQHDTATESVDVVDETPPTARIDAPTTASVGETIEFSGADSDDNHRIETYQWDVESGPSRDDATFEHAFDAPGEYTVALTVEDPTGNADATNVTVNVTERVGPVASLSAPGTATVGEPVTLNASDSQVGANATYQWFADGESLNETADPTYETSFDEPGTANVSVVVTDENDSDEATTTIDVVEPLNASVEATPANATVGEPVVFDAGASTGATTYEWDLDDGTNASGNATIEHAYDVPGEYEATVTVGDEDGNTDTATVVVTVDESSDEGPTAALALDPETATVGDEVTFDATDSDVGTNATYDWFVGDDRNGSTDEPTFTRTFTTAGTFEVRVEITDDNGTDSANATLVVEEDDADGGSGGSGGGGGGGGYGPPPSEPDDPVETTVDVVNGTIVVTAENVDARESFTVEIPANATAGFGAGRAPGNASSANQAGPIELRSVEIEAAQHADRMRIEFDPADRDVPGRFVGSPAIVTNSSADVASFTYEFGVDRAAATAAGVSADDLTAYAYDDEWRSVGRDATTRIEGERIVVRPTVDSDAPVGVGADGPVLYVSDVETTGVTTDGTVALAVRARNTGTDPDEWSVPVAVNGQVVAEESIALAPGEETTVETTLPVGETGTAAVSVGQIPRDVAVVHVTDLSPSPSAPGPNETAAVRAELVNRGAAGEVEVPLRVGDEVVTTRTVSLASGERRTLTLEYRTPEPGSYPVAVGDANATVEVAERERFTGGDSERTESALPGFGVLAALLVLVGLLSAGAVGYRRRRG